MTTPTAQGEGPQEELWEAFRGLAEVDPANSAGEAEIDRLFSDMQIRQHLYSFFDATDAKDLERMLDHFGAGATVTFNHGSYVGKEEIRGRLVAGTLLHLVTFHNLQSLAVRVRGAQGSVAAYLHAAHIGAELTARSLYGRLLCHLEKGEEGWRISELRISIDHRRGYPSP
jgi:ketosteroid isomerase-like protein